MDSLWFASEYEKGLYLSSMRPVFNKKALFCDYSEDYIIPLEPSPYGLVKLRFRTGKNNVDYVFLLCNGERLLMEKLKTVDDFDYYEFEYQLNNERITYCFEINCGKLKCYYSMKGVSKHIDTKYKFSLCPGFKTPAWAKGAVIYQIYIDRFYNGDKSNDVETNEYRYIGEGTVRVEDWNKYPAVMGVREFYGGDLQGVIDKLDYLSELGIDAIYFNPLFVSPSNHKYDIQDYDYIDPHVGKIVDDRGELLQPGSERFENRFATKYINRVTNKKNLEASNELFIKVVEEAHKRNIKVILDGVFNHCGSFNKWMDRERIYENSEGYEKGAFVDENSPYRNFFKFHAEGWPYNAAYDGWWGHDTLSKLNYEGSSCLYEYMLHIARKWVSPPFHADGWRLDVAADLGYGPEINHRFWKDFRRAVKEANPDAIIIAEHYGDPSAWLQGDEWDTVMNYDAFMEPVTWFLTGMQKHSDDYREDLRGNAGFFKNMIEVNTARFSAPSLFVAMNELSNHDHSRFLTRTNRVVGRVSNKGSQAADCGVNKAVFREAVLIQMTWFGAPTIYYGDEAGVCGFTDPDNRRTYPWGNEDKELIRFHKELIRIHKENQVFKTGSGKWLALDYNILAYGRFSIREQCLILVNNNDCEKKIAMKVWAIGVPREGIVRSLIYTDEKGFHMRPEEYIITKGRLEMILPKTSAIILKVVK
ncbi:MAG TPA: glycoside hydrolase family 13 protein [Lachnospiraceae bacterium]|nr:glycoside hydrolase family 13 protein [Lachnospiraceae bacterium]